MATVIDRLRAEARWDAAIATKTPERLAREFASLIGVLGYDRKEYDRLARLVSVRLWDQRGRTPAGDFEIGLDDALHAKGWPRVDWLGIGEAKMTARFGVDTASTQAEYDRALLSTPLVNLGYTCPECGQWVGSFTMHCCPGRIGPALFQRPTDEQLRVIKEALLAYQVTRGIESVEAFHLASAAYGWADRALHATA